MPQQSTACRRERGRGWAPLRSRSRTFRDLRIRSLGRLAIARAGRAPRPAGTTRQNADRSRSRARATQQTAHCCWSRQLVSAPDTLCCRHSQQRVSGAVSVRVGDRSVLGWVPKCPDFAWPVECPDAKCPNFARNLTRGISRGHFARNVARNSKSLDRVNHYHNAWPGRRAHNMLAIH